MGRLVPLEELQEQELAKIRLVAQVLPGVRIWDVRSQTWRPVQPKASHD